MKTLSLLLDLGIVSSQQYGEIAVLVSSGKFQEANDSVSALEKVYRRSL